MRKISFGPIGNFIVGASLVIILVCFSPDILGGLKNMISRAYKKTSQDLSKRSEEVREVLTEDETVEEAARQWMKENPNTGRTMTDKEVDQYQNLSSTTKTKRWADKFWAKWGPLPFVFIVLLLLVVLFAK